MAQPDTKGTEVKKIGVESDTFLVLHGPNIPTTLLKPASTSNGNAGLQLSWAPLHYHPSEDVEVLRTRNTPQADDGIPTDETR